MSEEQAKQQEQQQQQQQQEKKEKAPKKAPQQQQHRVFELPGYWEERNTLFQKAYDRQAAELAAKEKTPIKVIVDGKEVAAKAWETTPEMLLKELSPVAPETIATNPIVAVRVDGVEWDLLRVLEPSADGKVMEWIFFDSEAGRHIFWHSSAHILGQALEHRFHGLLNVGPATDSDFYYDMAMTDDSDKGTVVSANDFGCIRQMCEKVVKERQPFDRVELTKAEAQEIFKYNRFKLAIIERVPEGERITGYRCGKLVDLCRGPHLATTGLAKAFAITSASSVYLEGRADSEALQRIHGLSFPSKAQLKEWEALMAEAAKRDHRKIGQDQELFFFHPYSPGSAFFLPRGYRIYQRLMDFMRAEYVKRGYSEVLAPNLYQSKLWEISGHWQHYKDCMFTLTVDEQPWALKPMNCPGHCLIFGWRARSYRELPIRMAEFGVLHRNELSGALHGLTRVRRFQQDDAHIFCRPDQIEQEIDGVLDLIRYTYGVFGFEFELELSTRPEGFLGEVALWDRAETALKTVLDKTGLKWKLNPGDGAFYGPKIDVHIRDALRRLHQCATIQLDFQLPIRFDLQYMTDSMEEGKKFERPVMIHRAVYGSIERFLAILIEHTAGKWPFWISPRQIQIVPVSKKFNDYAREVAEILTREGFYADVDDSDKTLQKKVMEAQKAQYNYTLVVGQEEASNRSVNIRVRGEKAALGVKTIQETIDMFKTLQADHK